eukprot:g39360.t1
MSFLLEKTLKEFLQISVRKSEQDLRVECRHLAQELIAASTRVKVRGEPLDKTCEGSVLLPADELKRLRDMLSEGNVTSVMDGTRVIRAVSADVFEDGQKSFGRVFAFLALIVVVIQKVAPKGPSQDEALLLADCVTDCLVQLRQACVHCQPKKW